MLCESNELSLIDDLIAWENSSSVPARSLLKNEILLEAVRPVTFSAGLAEALHLNLGARGYPIRFGADLSAVGQGLRR